MKLTELAPRWLAQDGRLGQGLTFRCPVHPDAEEGDERAYARCVHPRVGIYFANPIDGGAPIPGEGARWQRSGETFEALTLTPSVNIVSPGGHWHGFIHAGEVSVL